MPIELDCPECQATLRVPDEAAGQQARCPHCEFVFEVAADVSNDVQAGATPAPPPPTPPPPTPSNPFAETTAPPNYRDAAQAPENPYAPPLVEPSTWGPNTTEMQLGQLDAGTALKISWEMLRANLPTLVLANGLVIVIVSVASGITESLRDMGDPGLVLLANLFGYAVQWFLGIGITLVNLSVARGRPADVGMVFSGGKWFLRVALATVLFTIIVSLGTILFIIPGLYLASRLWAYQCFIVDRDCGVVESLNLSSEFMEGNKMQSVIMMFLSIVVALMGFFALCVGLFFAIPVITMMWVIAYLMVTRQPIQRPVPS